jgi:hypothetical protein
MKRGRTMALARRATFIRPHLQRSKRTVAITMEQFGRLVHFERVVVRTDEADIELVLENSKHFNRMVSALIDAVMNGVRHPREEL